MAFQPPLRNALAVTPSDSTIFSPELQAFYVGGVGNVSLVTPGGDSVTLTAVIVGTVYYIQCKQILAATTATLIIGLF